MRTARWSTSPGPTFGVTKAKTYLWPSEFLTLVGSDQVPVRWRRLFALAVYTYMRAGELDALEWSDVDLEHGTFHVHAAIDRLKKGKKEKATKSETARRLPIEPMLLPLPQGAAPESGGKGHVLKHALARRALAQAQGLPGTSRSRSAPSCSSRTTPPAKAITFHDLRATGTTWMAVRGDDPLRIMQRAGHADFQTTQLYMREAENLAHGFGAVFRPSPPPALDNAPISPRGVSRLRKWWKFRHFRWS